MTEIIWKATVLLAAAWAAQALLARASAALRHFLWTGAFAALLLLPLALRIVPKWRPQPVAVVVAVEQVTTVSVHPGRPATRPVAWPLWLWALGSAAPAAWFLMGAARTAWMVRHASPVGAPGPLPASLGLGRKVRVLESAATPMPLAWGILRPVVLLPPGAADWPAGRMHTVLLHELIHVHRRDLLAQAIAQAACCLFWFHPLAWLGLRQQRRERERACDDAVLQRGVAPHDYAGHLLDMVRGMASRRARWSHAPAMAEASGLELRVRDLLAHNRNRRPLTSGSALAAAGAIAAILVPLAAFTALAQAPMAGLSGTVEDPSGAVVPNARVSAKNLDGSNEETTIADAAGIYRFASIPAGSYTLEFASPGFRKATVKAVLVTGSAARVDARLALGEIGQVVTVQGHGPQPAAAPSAGTPQRIRVGGMVQAAQLIHQGRPEYPAYLQEAGVQGVVRIRAIISKDGTLLHPQVINTVDPRLAQLALDALSQWLYQPTLLNGEPVEVVTSIDINFSL